MVRISSVFKEWSEAAKEMYERGVQYNQAVERLVALMTDNESVFEFSPEAVNILFTFSDFLREIRVS